ncbi:metallophosphoesterase 1-like [Dendronephthya gigantea]|uniref:metallophosphoesterase 1-like n=1 Tax=Dendronephthya gigantea TaxID=151771 RepID=UPI0010692BED|nr:metallophosphoesterase 1-like [Dendronephthya gigantea]
MLQFMDILKRLLTCILIILFCCEYLIYKVVIYQCSWPLLESKDSFRNGKFVDKSQNVHAILLSDPHLLGPRYGHWFDKLRREWQMRRSFQTAMNYFDPEVVFILGDVFDEGMICTDNEWEHYVSRFHDIFHHPEDVQLHIIPGNHDIGFHYRMLGRSELSKRFQRDFNITGVNFVNLKGNVFILVNSMALEQDGCSLCTKAEENLKSISSKLKCLHKDKITLNFWKKKCELEPFMSDPILLQHFPLYRSSEVNCTGRDSPPAERRQLRNRDGWEVLSQDASELLMTSLQPRAIFSGHTHHSCHVIHNEDIHEFTLPSFSWRNRNDPSFILAVFNPNTYSIQKCFLPEENSVIFLYILLGVCSLFYTFWNSFRRNFHRSQICKMRIFYHREPVKIC